MNKRLDDVLTGIGEEYKDRIDAGSRFYLEVDIGKRAGTMGFDDIKDTYAGAHAIVPLKRPELGMTVRIDGRTFVNYALYDSGIATPGYVARESGLPQTGFVANDSMLLNCA